MCTHNLIKQWETGFRKGKVDEQVQGNLARKEIRCTNPKTNFKRNGMIPRNLGAKQSPLVGFRCVIQPGESRIGLGFCVRKRGETGAGRRVSVQAVGNQCAESRTTLQGQSWNTTIFKSLKIVRSKNQCVDVAIIFVNNEESSTDKIAMRIRVTHEEHQLRGARDVVRHHTESDLETEE